MTLIFFCCAAANPHNNAATATSTGSFFMGFQSFVVNSRDKALFRESVELRCFSRVPLRIIASAIVERLLRSHSSRGKSRIEICAAHRFAFGNGLAKKCCEAADEGVSSASTIDTLHRERGNMLHPIFASQQRPVRAERDDDSLHAARQELLGALFGLIDILNR